jgi:signal transduction histidine kinase
LKIKLRYILTIAFTIVAVVPVLFLGSWVTRTALKKELDAAWEKHLVLADHTVSLLESYALDVEEAFEFFAALDGKSSNGGSAALVAKRLGLSHFCIVDEDLRVLRDIRPDPAKPPAFNRAIMQKLVPLAYNHVAYSGIMRDPEGQPTIYLFKRLDKHRVALAALTTDYFIRLQSTVSFGDRGFAVIVDQFGAVIAHPNDAWRRGMRNIADLEPVRHTLLRERGVTTYVSDTMQQELISGFATVPQTGWGVMVSQPIPELAAKAQDVRQIALILVICGVVVAAVVSWIFAGRLTRPLDALQLTARRIANGKLQSRVPPLPRFTASDLCELADAFNDMAARIQVDQEALTTAVGRAQSADRAKTKFLANMSHELRTPLNAIIGFSQTMENRVFGPIGNARYATYATDIRQSGEHLLSIINFILDLSKIEGGDMTVENDVVDVTSLLNAVHTMLKGTAEDGQVMLTLAVEPALPGVRGSEVKLKQTLANLVSNAIKYTPRQGSVEINAWRDPGGGISIAVRDTGIGMSKADLTMALVPFGRVSNEMSDRVGGTGLGLPLAKRFAEIHGGRLEIESAPNAGTTVTIHLPASRIIADVA